MIRSQWWAGSLYGGAARQRTHGCLFKDGLVTLVTEVIGYFVLYKQSCTAVKPHNFHLNFLFCIPNSAHKQDG